MLGFGKKDSKNFKCAKCGKEKKESEGNFYLDGTQFCCKECCGDAVKGENKEKADKVCEFC
jgi:hypothetical protein